MALWSIGVGLLVFLAASPVFSQYQPTWESIDSRPLPSWYDESKFGIFLHWGVFSVPSFESEWFWSNLRGGEASVTAFMKKNYKPGFTYQDFAKDFTASMFNATEWAGIFNASGARYLVLTTKHHEGYTLWPSTTGFSWNAMDVGPKQDLVGTLANAIRAQTKIKFGVYHSMYDWFNPLYLEDKKNNYKTQKFAYGKAIPELHELVNNYKPDVIWSDGDWEAPAEYWNSTGFLAWLYNESPVKDTVVTNDRWGVGTPCKHGGFYSCNDRYNPGTIQKHKWENAMTVDKASWGYRRNMVLDTLLTIKDIITTLAETVSCGGNMLMNVGPTSDGRIIPIFEERLRQTGDWLNVNGEAIYYSKPWKACQNDTVTPGIWYTTRIAASGATDVYAIVLTWPKANKLMLGCPQATATTKVTMLGYEGMGEFGLQQGLNGAQVDLPPITIDQLPSTVAWVLKFEGLKN